MSKMTIAKQFTFDSAHFLAYLPADHMCSRVHGHTYTVELQIVGRPHAATGFCGGIDYADLGKVYREHVHSVIDHRTLNDVPGLEIPTTENLVVWIFDRLREPIRQLAVAANGVARLMAVRVKESSTTWCELVETDSNGWTT